MPTKVPTRASFAASMTLSVAPHRRPQPYRGSLSQKNRAPSTPAETSASPDHRGCLPMSAISYSSPLYSGERVGEGHSRVPSTKTAPHSASPLSTGKRSQFALLFLLRIASREDRSDVVEHIRGAGFVVAEVLDQTLL